MAQNLIPNPSFEKYKKLPTGLFTDHFPLDTFIYDWKAYNSVDYYNGNENFPLVKLPQIIYPPGYLTGNKDSIKIQVYPISGIAFTGIQNDLIGLDKSDIFYYSEYLQCNLKKTLSKNTKYNVFFYYYNVGFQGLIISDLGMLITKNDTCINLYEQANHSPTYFGNKPQIINTTGLITNGNVWEKISGNFKAHGGEQLITIGYFKQTKSLEILDSSKAYVLQDHASSFENYFYIDSVSLTEILGIVGNDSVCKNEQMMYYSTLSGPFIWSDKNDASNVLSTDSIFNFTAEQSSWYYLFTPNGKDSIYLTVLPIAQISLGHDTSFCQGETMILYAKSNSLNILWQDKSKSEYYTVINSGKYWAMADLNGCLNSDTINVIEYPLPFKLDKHHFEICSINNQLITIQPNPINHYIWQDGDTSVEKILKNEGCFKVKIINSNACFIIDSICVYDICSPTLFIPNAFVPSGINKLFKPIGHYIEEIEWSIYNRWGERVFITQNLNESWDGTYNGTPCDAGVYLYQIKYKGVNSTNTLLKNGTVTLLR